AGDVMAITRRSGRDGAGTVRGASASPSRRWPAARAVPPCAAAARYAPARLRSSRAAWRPGPRAAGSSAPCAIGTRPCVGLLSAGSGRGQRARGAGRRRRLRGLAAGTAKLAELGARQLVVAGLEKPQNSGPAAGGREATVPRRPLRAPDLGHHPTF